jgi:hypothetical protein
MDGTSKLFVIDVSHDVVAWRGMGSNGNDWLKEVLK